MAGPLEGITVVEAGVWVAGPATAAILADWGASVIKIEPPAGDPVRGMGNPARRTDVNPPFEMDNRGKRGIALNLAHPDGYTVARRLIDQADVFVTNLIPASVERLKLTYEDLHDANPGLIYCRITGYGPAGPERDRPSFDAAAYWSRSGIMASLEEPGHPPPTPRGGMGDHATAVAAVAGICAALLARVRTGQGQIVDTSLYRTGIYAMGWDLAMQLRVGAVVAQTGRHNVNNPLVNPYRAGDGRWFYLVNLQADRYWPGFCRAIGRVELLADPRFSDIRTRREHAAELVTLLDEHFATRPRAEWGERFDQHGIVWAKGQTVQEVTEDEQAARAGGIVEARDASGAAIRMVAPPAGFSATPEQVSGVAPELGQHTEAILLDLGYSWEAIAGLKASGAIP